MNIFILDYDMTKSVQMYPDKHVVKMILEYAQLLSSASRLMGLDQGYKLTHQHHPCTKWLLESITNWSYLWALSDHLNEEWKYRWQHDHNHKSFEVILDLEWPLDLPDVGLTRFAQAMPDEYKHTDAVEAYRAYFNGEKRHLFNWTNRPIPEWISYEQEEYDQPMAIDLKTDGKHYDHYFE